MLKKYPYVLLIGFCCNALYGQGDSLSLSSGNATSGSATLTLSLTSSAGYEPAALEWEFSYPSGNVASVSAAAGTPLTAAGKTLSCYQDPVAGLFACVAAGTNSNIIANGAVASITFTMTSLASGTSVGLTAIGSDGAGGVLNMAPTGGTITGAGSGSTSGGGGGGTTGSLSLACPDSVTAGSSGTCTVTLPTAAPSGGGVVTLSSNTAAATVPASLTIAAGVSSATFAVTASQVSSNVTATITVTYNGSSVTNSILIRPAGQAVSSLSCSPAVVAGADPSTCTITLGGPAPSGGASVTISDNSSVTSEPASVTVPSGASSANFTVSTAAVTSNQAVTLTAAYGGATQTATVSIVPAVPLSGVSCALPIANGTQVMANSATAACTVSLSGNANANQTISLTRGPGTLTVPASISIPAGSNSASFTAKSGTLPSNTQAASITATGYGSSASFRFTLSVQVSSIVCTPSAIAAQNATSASTCKVVLSQSAPAVLAAAITNSSATSLSTPSSVSIPAGSSSATFTATAVNVPFIQVALTASFSGIGQSAAVNVGWPTPASLTCTPAVLAALGTAVCTVTMKGPIPAGGTKIVDLRSSSSLLSVPATITLSAGATSGTFIVTALAGYSGPVTVSAISGATASFTISSAGHSKPASGSSGPVSSLICSPRSIQAGSASVCQLQLNGPSSEARDIQLSVSGSSILAPTTVTSRPNQSTLSFQAIADRAAQSGTVSIRAISGRQAVEERISVISSAEPVLTVPARQAVKVGSKLSFDVSASSAAAGPVVLRAGSLPEGASFDATQGRFEWIPRGGQQGRWDIVFSATDTTGASASARVPIEAGSGVPLLRAVMHAAAGSDQEAACAPGSLASAEGDWLSDATASDPGGQIPALAGARVMVNGRYAPVVYSSPQRIVFICPAASQDALSVSVETEAGRSASVQARAKDSAPGIFTMDGLGKGQAAAAIFGGLRLAMARNYRFASQPAQPGDSLWLSVTGLSAGADASRLVAVIGGAETRVDSLRAMPGWVGVTQVAVTIPAAASIGDSIPIAIRESLPDGRVANSPAATIAIEAVGR